MVDNDPGTLRMVTAYCLDHGYLVLFCQVYEYYISHHLSKAFESLFGSVSCLPGCFSLYRVRTADKGRPVIISSRIIDEYAEGNIDTLHKKNLFSLGEDRFLTTLLLKHFPTFKTKFIPDAVAHTMAPESWRVLFSQRRRWINSTIHNLLELVVLPELCGFCCFSMRFFVFIDLLGTLVRMHMCCCQFVMNVFALDSSCYGRIRRLRVWFYEFAADVLLALLSDHCRGHWASGRANYIYRHVGNNIWSTGRCHILP